MSSALRRQGLVIVATLATAYVASHFFRAANVTIGLDLMRDLAIGPEALGALTGAFFFGFSAMLAALGGFWPKGVALIAAVSYRQAVDVLSLQSLMQTSAPSLHDIIRNAKQAVANMRIRANRLAWSG
jgi:hypothetical protein